MSPKTYAPERTIAQIQEEYAAGTLTAVALTQEYLARIEAIDRSGPEVRAVLETNPDALALAASLDAERQAQGPRGPLHGVPVLLKDNIDTGDAMQTTAGSLALVGEPAGQDATVAAALRAAGAVILGKVNLSEWANFRGFKSTSGWSGRGGRTKNPYALDRNTSGSSSGSAAAVAANLCAAALGTETDGSVISPSNACGVVGVKPTVGLTSRAGVVPIAASQDTVGVHAHTVADAAAVLGAIAAVQADPRDAATAAAQGHAHADYLQFLVEDGLRGARIGVVRNGGMWGYSYAADQVGERAVETLRAAGAEVVDPVEFPEALSGSYKTDLSEIIVLVYEFKRDLNAYLASRAGVPARSMAEVIAFNRAHAERELPWFGQEWMELAESGIISQQVYEEALAQSRDLAGRQGIDAVLEAHNLDALVAPSGAPAWMTDYVNGDQTLGGVSSPAARCGYPLVTVPAGLWAGLPVGFTFMGRAWSEPVLLRLAHAFEQATHARVPPTFAPTLPDPAGAAPGPRVPVSSVQAWLDGLRAGAPLRAPHAILEGLAAHLGERGEG